MKRHRFALEPVLRVRRLEEDAARASLLAANRGLAAADEAVARSLGRYRAIPAATGPQPAGAWLRARTSSDLTAATVLAAGTAREQSRSHVEAGRDQLQAVRRRVKALDRLAERRRDEHALAARREEDAEADELVTTRHGRTRA